MLAMATGADELGLRTAILDYARTPELGFGSVGTDAPPIGIRTDANDIARGWIGEVASAPLEVTA